MGKAGAMKAAAMKGAAAMSKSGLVNAMIEGTEVKGSVCKQLLDNLAAVATKEVKGVGKFTIPGLCMLKLKNKPATKAGKKEVSLIFPEKHWSTVSKEAKDLITK